jgi:hypothetical protein
MIEIKDKLGSLCHLVLTLEDFPAKGSRIDVVEPQNFLQLALMHGLEGISFRAHRHLERRRTFDNLRAQEAWVILSGSVEVTYFDEQDELLGSVILDAGSVSVTLRGGHAYRINEDAKVFEFKSGPYEGLEIDKKFI